jgi:hypothetical protein
MPRWYVMASDGSEMLALVCSQCGDVVMTLDGQASCCHATHCYTGDRSDLPRIATAHAAV